jgi:hypothetical protein
MWPSEPRDGAECTTPASFAGTFADNTYSEYPSNNQNFFGFNFRFCDGTAPVNDGTIALIDGRRRSTSEHARAESTGEQESHRPRETRSSEADRP